jgi:hypothetical protein
MEFFPDLRVFELEKVCVALGGNAILRYKDKGTAEEQFENVRRTKYLVRMISPFLFGVLTESIELRDWLTSLFFALS